MFLAHYSSAQNIVFKKPKFSVNAVVEFYWGKISVFNPIFLIFLFPFSAYFYGTIYNIPTYINKGMYNKTINNVQQLPIHENKQRSLKCGIHLTDVDTISLITYYMSGLLEKNMFFPILGLFI